MGKTPTGLKLSLHRIHFLVKGMLHSLKALALNFWKTVVNYVLSGPKDTHSFITVTWNTAISLNNSGISLWGVDNDWNMFISGLLHSIEKFQQIIFSSRLTNGFFACLGGTISEDWNRFVLITGRTKMGHVLMQRIAETVGELFKGDWGRSQLITGENIGGQCCSINCIQDQYIWFDQESRNNFL